jgi:hypothetical protein
MSVMRGQLRSQQPHRQSVVHPRHDRCAGHRSAARHGATGAAARVAVS